MVVIAGAAARRHEEEANLLLMTNHVTWKAEIQSGFLGRIKEATVEAPTLAEVVEWLANNPAANPNHGCAVSFRGLGLGDWHIYKMTFSAEDTSTFVKDYREDVTAELTTYGRES